MDPGEGTSDGRVRRKLGSVAVEIKQEPDIKEEPSDGSEFRLVTRPNETFVGDAVDATLNMESADESEYDFVHDIDLNDVKEEVKCEDEKPDKDPQKDPSGDSDSDRIGSNAYDGQDKEVKVNSKVDRNRFNRSGKGKKRDGSRKRTEHQCHVCGHVASQKCNLIAHIRIHTGDKPYKCDDCSKSFTQKSNLNQHKKIHSGEKRFECPVCFKSFTEKSHLNCHLRTHTDQLPHSCSKCGQRFAGGEAKQSHQNGCKRRRYECYLCKYKSFLKGNLKTHMQSKHTGEHRFQCEICGKKLIEKGHLNQHFATHRDQFSFGYIKCHRGFTNVNDQAKHEKICCRRQYECFMCEYFTWQTTNLRNHMRGRHTGERPFQCKWCKARFSQRSNASTHMKRCHLSKK